jgi:hypothetical protein
VYTDISSILVHVLNTFSRLVKAVSVAFAGIQRLPIQHGTDSVLGGKRLLPDLSGIDESTVQGFEIEAEG